MRAIRGRAKKLIVAFHFQLANQAAWKCDTCRKGGLQARRNCGWSPVRNASTAVWARQQVVCDCCPVSYISAESHCLLEEYSAWKLFGHSDFYALPARVVDAIALLETEFRKETLNAQE